MKTNVDLVVIGSGTAGSVVASKGRAAGWSVAVIDELPFGGTCALRGCDPKKVLVGAADVVDSSRRLNSKGVLNGDLTIDWPKLMAFKRSFTGPVPKQKEDSFAKAGIKSFHGHARFVGRNAVEAGGEVLEGRFIVLATGAKPATLDIPGEQYLIDSTQFLELEQIPAHIVFVGGGYIAMEFAHVAIRAGGRVTIFHRGGHVLERFDEDLVAKLAEHTRQLGISLHTNTKVESVESADGKFIVHARRLNPPATA